MVFLRELPKKVVKINSTLDICLKFFFLLKRLRIRFCLLRELTASQLVAITTRSDTRSHNRLDLIHSLLPTHYISNGYISPWYIYIAVAEKIVIWRLKSITCSLKYNTVISIHKIVNREILQLIVAYKRHRKQWRYLKMLNWTFLGNIYVQFWIQSNKTLF